MFLNVNSMTYLIPEIDLNEVVRRMNAERLAEWQRSKAEWQDTFSKPVLEDRRLNKKTEEKISEENFDLVSDFRYIKMPVIFGYGIALANLREACRNDPKSRQPI